MEEYHDGNSVQFSTQVDDIESLEPQNSVITHPLPSLGTGSVTFEENGKNWCSKNSVSSNETDLSFAFTTRTNASIPQIEIFPDNASQRSLSDFQKNPPFPPPPLPEDKQNLQRPTVIKAPVPTPPLLNQPMAWKKYSVPNSSAPLPPALPNHYYQYQFPTRSPKIPHNYWNTASKLAGRRGKSRYELQYQSHIFAIVQRLCKSASELGIDPVELYQSQMMMHMSSYLGSAINISPHSFVVPGSYPLDHQSYAFLDILRAHPHLAEVNLLRKLPEEMLSKARYFLLMFNSELDIFRAVKYSQVQVSPRVSSILNVALKKSMEGNVSKVFIFFAFSEGRRCVGLAELEHVGAFEPGKNTMISLKWLTVKDMGTGVFITGNFRSQLKDDRSVCSAQSSDSKPFTVQLTNQTCYTFYTLKQENGIIAVSKLLRYFSVNSMLLDFKMFDEAERNHGKMPPYYRIINSSSRERDNLFRDNHSQSSSRSRFMNRRKYNKNNNYRKVRYHNNNNFHDDSKSMGYNSSARH